MVRRGGPVAQERRYQPSRGLITATRQMGNFADPQVGSFRGPRRLVVLDIRRDGQKILPAVRHIGGESQLAWRGVLDDLIARG
jgi:hypothetical protein